MKASILAVGTELTTGQIINRNAATLSEKLNSFGVQTQAHLTVPDQENLILDSLHYVEKFCDLIFVTGGLGPTSDDFTREVIAKWLQVELIYDEKSWAHIVNRLSARGFQVREIQKQQCFYPAGASILENKEGTANAFQVKRSLNGRTQNIFVLPGPPREIESLWADHLEPWLQNTTRDLKKRVTKSWDTLGVGESDVAVQVEEILARFPKSNQLEIGYRVHLPYVEVKVTYDQSQNALFHETLLQIDEKLKDITMAKNFEDIAVRATKKLSELDFTFYDFLTQGFLHKRLSPLLKNIKRWSFKQSTTNEIGVDFFANEENFLALLPREEHSCQIIGEVASVRFQKLIEAPMKSSLMSERRLQYFAEMALIELSKALP